MKNKIELQKLIKRIFFFLITILIIFIIVNIYEYKKYNENFNNKINSIVEILLDKYPNLSEKEIVDILNNDVNSANILKKYGMDLNNKSIVKENEKLNHRYLIVNIIFLILIFMVLILFFSLYLKKQNKQIEEITKYLKELNNKNYDLKIDSNSEDELSILKNEIYKTMVMLKETKDISLKDKINLKKSLEDISHQIKTPLTSILVMLDNLIDDSKMDDKIKEEFIRDIKRNVTNINFLVQNILKLSKFDANSINFVKEKKFVKDILEEANKNVSILCDLKNIKIKITGDEQIMINCDFRWQVEAITNIIKNCVEYSFFNSKIDIFFERNSAYVTITIKDYGCGIDNQEINKIFERFYKGKKAYVDSIGIGLALAKTIIENDNGLINVTSDEKGTKFVIKYFC